MNTNSTITINTGKTTIKIIPDSDNGKAAILQQSSGKTTNFTIINCKDGELGKHITSFLTKNNIVNQNVIKIISNALLHNNKLSIYTNSNHSINATYFCKNGDVYDDYDNEDDFTLNATTLKGYAEYMEDANTIHLKDDNNNFVLNLKVPQKISASKGMDLQDAINSKRMARYSDAEYNIAPNSVRTASKKGDFTFGALYGNEVDSIAMLESETGLFTKYEKSRFALSTTYKKNLNTTYNQFYDTISLAPEFKLNNYMSIKNEYKADLTRNRKSGALIFSFNPFGKKDSDRMRLELGAKQTIYEDNVTTKTEFSFSTQFKL